MSDEDKPKDDKPDKPKTYWETMEGAKLRSALQLDRDLTKALEDQIFSTFAKDGTIRFVATAPLAKDTKIPRIMPPVYRPSPFVAPPSGRAFADLVVALGDEWMVAVVKGEPEMTLLLHVDGLWCLLVSEETLAMTEPFAGQLREALKAAVFAGEHGPFRGAPVPKRTGPRDL